MKVYEAPERPSLEDFYNELSVKIFLAGGITDCEDWQSKVINNLKDITSPSMNLMIFNPRRSNFDVNDKSAAKDQISWEFTYLNNMDFFTMYFAKSETSVQPICMYELGRHLERMQHRFPRDWKERIVIACEDGYKRVNDVVIQTELAAGIFVYQNCDTDTYSRLIVQKLGKLRNVL